MGDVVDIGTGKSKSGHGNGGGHVTFDPKVHCGGKKRTGGKCTKTKGFGTSHPGTGRCKHHGGSTASGEKAAAKEAATIMGEQLDVEPHEALLTGVRIAAGEVAYCSAQIAELELPTVSTMFGPKMDIWIEVRQGAVAQLAKYSKMALDAGVAERQVQLAERYGEMLATLISGILGELELTAKQQKAAPVIVTKHLQLLEAAQGA